MELVTDYLENALPQTERERFDAHVSSCKGCRAYLDQMETTVQLVGHLPAPALAAEAERVLLHAFRDWKSGRAPST